MSGSIRSTPKREHDDPLALRRALARPRHPIVTVVDNVRSVYNVGSVFRVSDGAWIERVVVSGISASPGHAGVEKTALGATSSVPWERSEDIVATVRALRARGYVVAALERTADSVPYTRYPTGSFPVCLLLGNEVDGLAPALAELADHWVEIPQYGYKTSLNVATAYAVAAYGLVERYRLGRIGGPAPPERT